MSVPQWLLYAEGHLAYLSAVLYSLQELTLVTKPGEGFGLAISGGVNGYPGNPMDETDEGIFISQVCMST